MRFPPQPLGAHDLAAQLSRANVAGRRLLGEATLERVQEAADHRLALPRFAGVGPLVEGQ